MEIDELMRAPGIRWIFRGYAILAAVAGLLLFGWGPVWIGAHLPELPFYQASLVRAAGGALMCAACFAAALDAVEDPDVRRRALLWLGIGHSALALVLLSQQIAVWESRLAGGVIMALAMAAFAFFFLWSGVDIGAGPNPNTPISLFGMSSQHRENLRLRYRRQIQEAALQEERHRLARDLHDSVKQQIFAIQTAAATAQTRFDNDSAGALAALDQVRASAREAMAEMEAMLDQLRAAPLETAGLVESLKKACEALQFRTGIAVEVTLGSLPDVSLLPPGAAEALFRIAQEALANIGRHARASQARVTLAAGATAVRLTVEDDGSGFNAEQPARGMGMENMRGRAAEFDGTFELASSPGAGTRIEVSIPLLKEFSIADYNRRIAFYAGFAALHIAFAAWRKDGTFLFLGVLWLVYCGRVAAGRSALRRRTESPR